MRDVDESGESMGHVAERANRVLVIEDEPAVLTVLTHALERVGYAVIGCADGVAAIRALERASYEAIVCDLSLPDINGVEIINEVRRRALDVPVVLTSGHSVEDASRAARELGALEYLEKPIEPPALRASVARAVAARRRMSRG